MNAVTPTGSTRRLLRGYAEIMEESDEEIAAEEGRLREMLALLIEDYEDRRHPLRRPSHTRCSAS